MGKLGRLAIVAVLCFDVYACGTRTGRDLSMAGAVQKFDQRRAAKRAELAKEEAAAEGIDLNEARRKDIKPLPPRRELLQVRVPQAVELNDVVDGVVANSMSAVNAVANSASALTASTANIRALESQLRAIDKRIELGRRERRTKQADYDREKLLLDQIDMRHAKARDLLLQEFKISHEKMLQEEIAGLDEQYQEAQPATVLGLTDNNEFGALALFGRNELARRDEYVSLQKSFLFIGNDVISGVSLGRMDDLAREIGSRTLSVNLDGLRLKTALRSLARSIGMQIYLSPTVDASEATVRLDIARADALDIFDILIDTYGLAMAYDRKMGVARFYEAEEFNERVEGAIAAAEIHNRRARNYRRVSSLENDTAAIRQIYKAYFQHPDDAGRARALTNDAIIEEVHSSAVSAAIVRFKEAALENERKLDELDMAQATERQEQLVKVQAEQFMLEDIDQALLLLATEKVNKDRQMAEMKEKADQIAADAPIGSVAAAAAGGASDVAAAATPAKAETPNQLVQKFLQGPDADVLRGRVINDTNLKTTEPVFTEKFTIYNSEGSLSCTGGESDRVAQVKTELEAYFGQLYTDEAIAAERRLEREAETARRKAREEAEAAERAAAQFNSAVASTNVADIASDLIVPAIPLTPPGGTAPGAATDEDAADAGTGAAAPAPPAAAPAAPPAQSPAPAAAADGDAPAADTAVEASFTDASFRRPTVTSVAETVIVTGFKRDVDLAATLIESLDKPDKQVLVEVFMVNVVKNWQRQLQGRLQNALRSSDLTDSDIANLPIAIREAYGDLVEVRNGGLVGVRGALNFANRAAAGNSFSLNNFRLGLAWTIDFMETNSLGRKVSSPTILALNGCPAKISKSETRNLPVPVTGQPITQPGGNVVPGGGTINYEKRTVSLQLTVTPTINPLNDHVKLDINFADDFFVTTDPNSDTIKSEINTKFIAAPGDVIVLAGLFTEDNSKSRNGLPGTTSVPLVSSILGTNTDAMATQEMVIFLAPQVITPSAGELPVNSATFYNVDR